MYRASFTRSSCLLSRFSIDVQWCVLLVVLAINIGAVHTFFTSTLMTVFSQNIGKKFPVSSSQQNLFFTSFNYYPFMCWCNSTQILEDECMCCLVVEFSPLSRKSYWAVVLTLFTQCTNLQNAVYTQNKDSLPYFSASWISRNSHFLFLNDLIISMKEH